VRASGRVRSVAGPGGKWRIAIVGAGDGAGGGKSKCVAEETGRGCVRVEEEGSGGDARAVEGVRDISRGVSGDFGDGGEAVKESCKF